jgi:hypothetical protein
MIGSPLRRAAAFAATLTLLLLGFEQWMLRDLRSGEMDLLDARLERMARAISDELDGAPLADAAPERLTDLARRVAGVADVRVTLIDDAGVVRADSDVYASHLASIENHGARAEVLAAAGRTRTRPSAAGGPPSARRCAFSGAIAGSCCAANGTASATPA